VAAGLVAADAALHDRLVCPAELATVAELCRNWPGARAMRAVLELTDARAESPLESVSRLRMYERRLPAPDLQARLGTASGTFIRRVDFYWPEFGVVGEADGSEKYASRADQRAEKLQQERLEDLDVVIVRWGWPDLYSFDAVATRLRSAFRRGIGAGRGQPWSVLAPGIQVIAP
jgi:hypothetical protein